MDIRAEPSGALATLYEEHHVALLRIAGLLLGDRAAAEDVVQEAFVRAHRALPGLRDHDKAPAYLRATVVNLCRSRHRHLDVVRRWRPEPATAGIQPDERAVLSDDQAAVLAAVRSLPHRQRACVVLRFYEHMSEAEIAKVLDVSSSTVKTHLQRGKAALAEKLEDRR